MKIKEISYHWNYYLLLGYVLLFFGNASPSRNQMQDFIWNDASLMQAVLVLSA
jgi:hypothetical protein